MATIYNIDFKPNNKQQYVMNTFYNNNEYDVCLIEGGVRAGKTTLGHVLCLIEALKNNGADVLVVRSTHDEAVNINGELFLKMFKGQARQYLESSFNRKEGILRLDNGSRIIFWGLGKPGEDKDVYEKIESAGFSFVFMDDARRIPYRVFNYVHTRMSGVGSRKILLSTNPPPTRHWLYREFYQSKVKGRIVINFSTYDNKENLPDDFFRKLEQLPVRWKRIYIDGEHGETYDEEGIFENEFSINTHVDEKYDFNPAKVYIKIVGGLDFGVPAAVIYALNINKTIDVFYEKRSNKESTIDFFDDLRYEIKEMFGLGVKNIKWRGDIAGSYKNTLMESDFNVLSKNFGINVVGEKIGLNESIFTIKNMLTLQRKDENGDMRPVIGIHPRCEGVINGFIGGYRCDESGKIIKDHELQHVMDALRYAIHEISYTDVPVRTERAQRYRKLSPQLQLYRR